MYMLYYIVFCIQFQYGELETALEVILLVLELVTAVPNNITSTGINAASNILENVAELETVSQEVKNSEQVFWKI